MDPWHWWLIAAILLIILEIFFSDFLLATLGAACLVTTAVAGFGADFLPQFGTFVVASAVALAMLRPAMKRWMYRTSDPLKTGGDALAGQTGKVTDPVGGPESPGRVKIGSEEWRAITETSETLEENTLVEIVSLDSATLVVRPKTPRS